MKLLLITYAATAAIALAQVRSVSGIISGVIKGEDGSLLQGAKIALHLVLKTQPKLGQQTTNWATVTSAGGVFQFAGVPAGNYTVCPSVPNTTWLNPCEWNFPTPTATITRVAPTVSVTITLKRGVAVPIRIEDAGQLVTMNERRTRGAGLLLEVQDRPGSFFRLVPLVSQDSKGRNHQIVIPFNTPLTLFVHPTYYHVSDAKGASLGQAKTTKIPLQVASGQQVSPIKLTITGAGN